LHTNISTIEMGKRAASGSESNSDEEFKPTKKVVSESESEEEKPKKKEKKEKKKEKKVKKQKVENSDSDSGSDDATDDANGPWKLSAMRQVSVSEFKGKQYVNIREYYEKDGEMLPGRKGISLPPDQWKKLMACAPQIDKALK